ncbi:titin-like [Ornithodoros turicata]|uniref:titin-like n=1 Tax=Ornithodoros turicata TaxID=34597 RepID=UPI0031386F7E
MAPRDTIEVIVEPSDRDSVEVTEEIVQLTPHDTKTKKVKKVRKEKKPDGETVLQITEEVEELKPEDLDEIEAPLGERQPRKVSKTTKKVTKPSGESVQAVEEVTDLQPKPEEKDLVAVSETLLEVVEEKPDEAPQRRVKKVRRSRKKSGQEVVEEVTDKEEELKPRLPQKPEEEEKKPFPTVPEAEPLPEKPLAFVLGEKPKVTEGEVRHQRTVTKSRKPTGDVVEVTLDTVERKPTPQEQTEGVVEVTEVTEETVEHAPRKKGVLDRPKKTIKKTKKTRSETGEIVEDVSEKVLHLKPRKDRRESVEVNVDVQFLDITDREITVKSLERQIAELDMAPRDTIEVIVEPSDRDSVEVTEEIVQLTPHDTKTKKVKKARKEKKPDGETVLQITEEVEELKPEDLDEIEAPLGERQPRKVSKTTKKVTKPSGESVQAVEEVTDLQPKPEEKDLVAVSETLLEVVEEKPDEAPQRRVKKVRRSRKKSGQEVVEEVTDKEEELKPRLPQKPEEEEKKPFPTVPEAEPLPEKPLAFVLGEKPKVTEGEVRHQRTVTKSRKPTGDVVEVTLDTVERKPTPQEQTEGVVEVTEVTEETVEHAPRKKGVLDRPKKTIKKTKKTRSETGEIVEEVSEKVLHLKPRKDRRESVEVNVDVQFLDITDREITVKSLERQIAELDMAPRDTIEVIVEPSDRDSVEVTEEIVQLTPHDTKTKKVKKVRKEKKPDGETVLQITEEVEELKPEDLDEIEAPLGERQPRKVSKTTKKVTKPSGESVQAVEEVTDLQPKPEEKDLVAVSETLLEVVEEKPDEAPQRRVKKVRRSRKKSGQEVVEEVTDKEEELKPRLPQKPEEEEKKPFPTVPEAEPLPEKPLAFVLGEKPKVTEGEVRHQRTVTKSRKPTGDVVEVTLDTVERKPTPEEQTEGVVEVTEVTEETVEHAPRKKGVLDRPKKTIKKTKKTRSETGEIVEEVSEKVLHLKPRKDRRESVEVNVDVQFLDITDREITVKSLERQIAELDMAPRDTIEVIVEPSDRDSVEVTEEIVQLTPHDTKTKKVKKVRKEKKPDGETVLQITEEVEELKPEDLDEIEAPLGERQPRKVSKTTKKVTKPSGESVQAVEEVTDLQPKPEEKGPRCKVVEEVTEKEEELKPRLPQKPEEEEKKPFPTVPEAEPLPEKPLAFVLGEKPKVTEGEVRHQRTVTKSRKPTGDVVEVTLDTVERKPTPEEQTEGVVEVTEVTEETVEHAPRKKGVLDRPKKTIKKTKKTRSETGEIVEEVSEKVLHLKPRKDRRESVEVNVDVQFLDITDREITVKSLERQIAELDMAPRDTIEVIVEPSDRDSVEVTEEIVQLTPHDTKTKKVKKVRKEKKPDGETVLQITEEVEELKPEDLDEIEAPLGERQPRKVSKTTKKVTKPSGESVQAVEEVTDLQPKPEEKDLVAVSETLLEVVEEKPDEAPQRRVKKVRRSRKKSGQEPEEEEKKPFPTVPEAEPLPEKPLAFVLGEKPKVTEGEVRHQRTVTKSRKPTGDIVEVTLDTVERKPTPEEQTEGVVEVTEVTEETVEHAPRKKGVLDRPKKTIKKTKKTRSETGEIVEEVSEKVLHLKPRKDRRESVEVNVDVQFLDITDREITVKSLERQIAELDMAPRDTIEVIVEPSDRDSVEVTEEIVQLTPHDTKTKKVKKVRKEKKPDGETVLQITEEVEELKPEDLDEIEAPLGERQPRKVSKTTKKVTKPSGESVQAVEEVTDLQPKPEEKDLIAVSETLLEVVEEKPDEAPQRRVKKVRRSRNKSGQEVVEEVTDKEEELKPRLPQKPEEDEKKPFPTVPEAEPLPEKPLAFVLGEKPKVTEGEVRHQRTVTKSRKPTGDVVEVTLDTVERKPTPEEQTEGVVEVTEVTEETVEHAPRKKGVLDRPKKTIKKTKKTRSISGQIVEEVSEKVLHLKPRKDRRESVEVNVDVEFLDITDREITVKSLERQIAELDMAPRDTIELIVEPSDRDSVELTEETIQLKPDDTKTKKVKRVKKEKRPDGETVLQITEEVEELKPEELDQIEAPLGERQPRKISKTTKKVRKPSGESVLVVEEVTDLKPKPEEKDLVVISETVLEVVEEKPDETPQRTVTKVRRSRKKSGEEVVEHVTDKEEELKPRLPEKPEGVEEKPLPTVPEAELVPEKPLAFVLDEKPKVTEGEVRHQRTVTKARKPTGDIVEVTLDTVDRKPTPQEETDGIVEVTEITEEKVEHAPRKKGVLDRPKKTIKKTKKTRSETGEIVEEVSEKVLHLKPRKDRRESVEVNVDVEFLDITDREITVKSLERQIAELDMAPRDTIELIVEPGDRDSVELTEETIQLKPDDTKTKKVKRVKKEKRPDGETVLQITEEVEELKPEELDQIEAPLGERQPRKISKTTKKVRKPSGESVLVVEEVTDLEPKPEEKDLVVISETVLEVVEEKPDETPQRTVTKVRRSRKKSGEEVVEHVTDKEEELKPRLPEKPEGVEEKPLPTVSEAELVPEKPLAFVLDEKPKVTEGEVRHQRTVTKARKPTGDIVEVTLDTVDRKPTPQEETDGIVEVTEITEEKVEHAPRKKGVLDRPKKTIKKTKKTRSETGEIVEEVSEKVLHLKPRKDRRESVEVNVDVEFLDITDREITVKSLERHIAELDMAPRDTIELIVEPSDRDSVELTEETIQLKPDDTKTKKVKRVKKEKRPDGETVLQITEEVEELKPEELDQIEAPLGERQPRKISKTTKKVRKPSGESVLVVEEVTDLEPKPEEKDLVVISETVLEVVEEKPDETPQRTVTKVRRSRKKSGEEVVEHVTDKEEELKPRLPEKPEGVEEKPLPTVSEAELVPEKPLAFVLDEKPKVTEGEVRHQRTVTKARKPTGDIVEVTLDTVDRKPTPQEETDGIVEVTEITEEKVEHAPRKKGVLDRPKKTIKKTKKTRSETGEIVEEVSEKVLHLKPRKDRRESVEVNVDVEFLDITDREITVKSLERQIAELDMAPRDTIELIVEPGDRDSVELTEETIQLKPDDTKTKKVKRVKKEKRPDGETVLQITEEVEELKPEELDQIEAPLGERQPRKISKTTKKVRKPSGESVLVVEEVTDLEPKPEEKDLVVISETVLEVVEEKPDETPQRTVTKVRRSRKKSGEEVVEHVTDKEEELKPRLPEKPEGVEEKPLPTVSQAELVPEKPLAFVLDEKPKVTEGEVRHQRTVTKARKPTGDIVEVTLDTVDRKPTPQEETDGIVEVTEITEEKVEHAPRKKGVLDRPKKTIKKTKKTRSETGEIVEEVSEKVLHLKPRKDRRESVEVNVDVEFVDITDREITVKSLERHIAELDMAPRDTIELIVEPSDRDSVELTEETIQLKPDDTKTKKVKRVKKEKRPDGETVLQITEEVEELKPEELDQIEAPLGERQPRKISKTTKKVRKPSGESVLVVEEVTDLEPKPEEKDLVVISETVLEVVEEKPDETPQRTVTKVRRSRKKSGEEVVEHVTDKEEELKPRLPEKPEGVEEKPLPTVSEAELVPEKPLAFVLDEKPKVTEGEVRHQRTVTKARKPTGDIVEVTLDTVDRKPTPQEETDGIVEVTEITEEKVEHAPRKKGVLDRPKKTIKKTKKTRSETGEIVEEVSEKVLHLKPRKDRRESVEVNVDVEFLDITDREITVKSLERQIAELDMAPRDTIELIVEPGDRDSVELTEETIQLKPDDTKTKKVKRVKKEKRPDGETVLQITEEVEELKPEELDQIEAPLGERQPRKISKTTKKVRKPSGESVLVVEEVTDLEPKPEEKDLVVISETVLEVVEEKPDETPQRTVTKVRRSRKKSGEEVVEHVTDKEEELKPRLPEKPEGVEEKPLPTVSEAELVPEKPLAFVLDEKPKVTEGEVRHQRTVTKARKPTGDIVEVTLDTVDRKPTPQEETDGIVEVTEITEEKVEHAPRKKGVLDRPKKTIKKTKKTRSETGEIVEEVSEKVLHLKPRKDRRESVEVNVDVEFLDITDREITVKSLERQIAELDMAPRDTIELIVEPSDRDSVELTEETIQLKPDDTKTKKVKRVKKEKRPDGETVLQITEEVEELKPEELDQIEAPLGERQPRKISKTTKKVRKPSGESVLVVEEVTDLEPKPEEKDLVVISETVLEVVEEKPDETPQRTVTKVRRSRKKSGEEVVEHVTDKEEELKPRLPEKPEGVEEKQLPTVSEEELVPEKPLVFVLDEKPKVTEGEVRHQRTVTKARKPTGDIVEVTLDTVDRKPTPQEETDGIVEVTEITEEKVEHAPRKKGVLDRPKKTIKKTKKTRSETGEIVEESSLI